MNSCNVNYDFTANLNGIGNRSVYELSAVYSYILVIRLMWALRCLTLVLLHPFYSSLDFVRDYPGELVPEPIWILLKQETVSGSGIRWAICKSAPRPRQITMSASHHSIFYRPDALPATQPTASKHWRQRHCLAPTSVISCSVEGARSS